MHNIQTAFSPPRLPSSQAAHREMTDPSHLHPQRYHNHHNHNHPHPQPSILSAASPATFENTSTRSTNELAATFVAVNRTSPQHSGIISSSLFRHSAAASTIDSNMNPQLHDDFSTAGNPSDPFSSFPTSMPSADLSVPVSLPPAPLPPPPHPVASSATAATPTALADPFPSAASFLNFIEEGQKMETKFTSILLESAIKLSSLTNASIFVMVETAHGGRKWAGRNSLRDNFLRGTLKVCQEDEELVSAVTTTSEESEKHISSSFAFKPTKDLSYSASSSDHRNQQSQPQQRSSQSSGNSSATSKLEEGTVVGIQAFTLPTDSASSEAPSSSAQGANNNASGTSGSGDIQDQQSRHQSSSGLGQPSVGPQSQRGESGSSPCKDLNSDFLDDAGGKRGDAGRGTAESDAGEGKSSLPSTLQPAPLLTSVSEQIRYMTSQLKMTPDQITNVLGLPLTYVQNQVILLNSVNRGNHKASALASSVSNVEVSGDFSPPSQALVPYPYANRGNSRGAPGRGRQRVDVNRMRALLGQRVPVKDIAHEMGVSRLCVYYWMQKFGINAYSRRSWTSSDQDVVPMNEENSNEIHNGSDSSVAGGYQEGAQTGSSASSSAIAPHPDHQQPPHQQQPLPSYMNSSPSRSQSGNIGRPRGANNKVDITLFKELVTRKVPVGEIAQEFGISRLAVYYHMHKLGFKPYMRPGRARGRGALPGNRGSGVTMGLTAGGMGFGGSSFGVRGHGGNGAIGIPGISRGASHPTASSSLSDADPLGAFQHQNPHRGFFEMSPGGLPTMVGYSNAGRFAGFPGAPPHGSGGGGDSVVPGEGGGEDGNGYSDEEGNLDDIKIEEGPEMDEDVLGDEDVTGSGLGDDEDDDDENAHGQNHVDPMGAFD